MEFESNTATKPRPTRPSLFRLYGRAIASESRRFYYALTRENIVSFLKTMMFAAPLTVLIWVYAESEQQVADTGQTINIVVKSRDPNKVVILDSGDSSVICDLQGPRSNLDRFKETISIAAPIVIELNTTQISNQKEYISTLDALRENPRFREAGITVQKCSPSMLPVYVDTLERRSLPVRLPPNVPVQDATFNPPTVTVTGPSRFFKSFTEVTADVSNLSVLNQPGSHTVENVALQPDPSGTLTFQPTQVKAILTVAEKDKPYTCLNVPIWVSSDPATINGYSFSLNNNGFVPRLDVIGPPEEIDQLKDHTPRAVLEIGADAVGNTNPVPLTIEGLPPHVRLAGPPPEVTFTAAPRAH
jgi:hypothetical protein